MKGYKKVLIAVNGSKEVLKKGLRLAADEKCWVTVVKVVPPYEGDINLVGIRDIDDALCSGGPREIAGFREMAEEEGALIKTRLEEGDVPQKIVEAAEEEDCDLIIIGSQKRNWIRRLFGDNVVEKVIDLAPCPVLVV
jgi:nucleotide-binding universal stress UspA family protein